MRKDYKDRVPGTLRRSVRRRRNPWVWAVPALVTGVAAVALFTFSGGDEPAVDPSSPTTTGAAPAAENKAAAASAGTAAAVPLKEKKALPDGKKKKAAPAEKVPEVDLPEPRFTFYKILPEKEVIVSESEIQNRARQEKAGQSERTGSYLIQAGSFKTREEAEKLKARLAEAKVNARMEQVMIENATWYRVKVGPYSNLIDAEKMRAYLRKNKLDSVLQQAKP